MDCVPENTKCTVTLHFSLSHTLKRKSKQTKTAVSFFLLFLTIKPTISVGRGKKTTKKDPKKPTGKGVVRPPT